MSERDTLRATLPPDVQDDLDALYQRTNDPDPRDLVAELHRQGLLDASQLKAAVIALETHNRIRQIAAKPPEGTAPEILGQLGHGAMGEVLIAKDPGLNRVVAVKRILPEAAKNKSMMRRFYTEAQITAQLDHPGIVPIHGLVTDADGGLAYAMKLVRGTTLEDFLDECSTEPDDPRHGLTARLERFLHVCDAMAYAHERGIVHRDLKPENIMVGAFGEVLVMDWGIAKILSGTEDLTAEAEPTTNTKGTRVGQVMGTPRYMSPEQAEGANDQIDARSDQYALGLILQEVTTLEPAIDTGLELPAVLGWAQQARRRPMKGAPRELSAIVDKACAKRPADRYADVAAFAEDVRRFLRDEAPLAAPDGMVGRVHRWIGRHRRTAVMLIAGLIGTVVIGGTGLIAAGAAALAYQQYQAQAREAALTLVLHRAMDRAAGVDASLAKIESLTTGVAYAAATAQQSPAPRVPYSVIRDDPERKVSAGRHGKASMEWASVGTIKSADSVSNDDLERLAALGDVMTRAMVSTLTGDARRIDAAERAEKLGGDAPVFWSRVGLVNGALAQAPGTRGYKDDLPPFKKEPWFAATKDQRGASWTSPTMDPGGLGQVVSVSVPWFDGDGAIAGVAAMDVSAGWLQKRIRAGKALVYLLDPSGSVLLSTETDVSKDPAPVALPHPQHVGYVTAGKAGWHEASDGSLAVWAPLRTTGWTWLIVGDSEALLAAADEGIQKN